MLARAKGTAVDGVVEARAKDGGGYQGLVFGGSGVIKSKNPAVRN